MPRPLDPTRVAQAAKFIAVFAAKLEEARKAFAEQYGVNPPAVAIVAERMQRALETGSYHHDGQAMKMTCRQLDIPHSRRGIEAYLKGANKQ